VDATSVASAVLGLLSLATLAALVLYGANAWVMIALHRRRGAAPRPAPPPPDPLPVVTVQLPMFNERYVAARLIAAAGALDYPRDRLEIQVLDDSTDDTADAVAAAVARLRARGVDAVHLRRDVRRGYKAGALAEGLAACRGELVAVFDADFVPPPDFLRRTLPHFGPGVAAVQARWGHLNRDHSTLTAAQALGMDAHFAVEQPARAWHGLFLNFNGTAGVWRRAAIEDAGGWQPDTLTEDLDLSYRAQLRGWRIVYRPEIVCPAELPVLVTGFKSQQRRWARGSIQTARKLLPAVLRADLPAWMKYQACVHLTYYAIHPLMILGLALVLPVHLLGGAAPGSAAPGVAALVLATATLGPATMLVYAQRVLGPGWWRRAWRIPALMVLGVGISLGTSAAVVGAFRRRPGDFVRTPKFGIDAATRSWRDKVYGDRAMAGGAVEIAAGAACAVAGGLLWRDGLVAPLPFLALYALGFLTVGGLTIVQSMGVRRRPEGAPRSAWLAARRGRRVAAGLAAGVAVAGGLLCAGRAAGGSGGAPAAHVGRTADPWEALVAEGERLWSRSPDPANPVACATCHHDPVAVSAWAASFPKVRPLPPPEARVMTLLQASAEAVGRHYRDPRPRDAAAAVAAYLAAVGAGRCVTPGRAEGQPVLEHRMAALAASVARGERRHARRCARCHDADAAAAAIADLPRLVRSGAAAAEIFLETHHPASPRLRWDGAEVADLLAYLAGRRTGRALGAAGAPPCREARR